MREQSRRDGSFSAVALSVLASSVIEVAEALLSFQVAAVTPAMDIHRISVSKFQLMSPSCCELRN